MAGKYIPDGAKITCPLCSKPEGTLKVTSNDIKLQGKPWATVADKGKQNLVFQGNCMKFSNNPPPCAGVISPAEWQVPAQGVGINGNAPLLEGSSIMCTTGGVPITISQHSQKSIPTNLGKLAQTGVPAPLPEEEPELRVRKVEGPKEVLIEKTYEFKATEFNKDPENGELEKVKWAYKVNNSKIKPFEKKGEKIKDKTVIKRIHINKSLAGKDLEIFAYVKKPSHKVSYKIKVKEPVVKKEIIIIVGTEQHSETKGNKLMFSAQAIREIRENYRTQEYLTLLIFKQGYNNAEFSEIKKAAKDFNKKCRIHIITSLTQLVNYINLGKMNGEDVRQKPNDNNEIILIETIKIFSHGFPSRLTFNLDGNISMPSQEFNRSHVSQLLPEAFDEGATIYSYACRTGNSGPDFDVNSYTESNWKSIVKPEESLAQKLADHLDIAVYAYIRRSNYLNTWNDEGNKGYQKKYVEIEDKSVDAQITRPSTWDDFDEALWNPLGAFGPVTSGDTPEGLPQGMFLFKKGVEPVKQ